MNEITVKIPPVPAGSYKIKIGSGFLAKFWDEIHSDFSGRNKFLITDENLVTAGHLQTLLGKQDVAKFVIKPAGETSKSISTVIAIMEAMEKASLGRDTLVVGLGGGTVGDIAGFVAAIFKRGVPVIHIPTTTVAQADSAIGGKTGVDSSLSKNAFGAFWHPATVYIDVATLKTLGDKEFMAGLVESVKHALIADANYFDFIEKNIDAILARENNALEKLAVYNCNIKAAVVETDPTEKNQRRMLNYGHTIGHAIESVSGYELLHGEAVAIGIIAAGLIEKELDLADNSRLERVRKILGQLSMPISLPLKISRKSLLETISRDKKAVNKWPPFVLTEKIGQVHRQNNQWAVDVKQEIVEKVLDLLKERKVEIYVQTANQSARLYHQGWRPD
jgi:3-dehydroquinate synthase